MAIRVNYASRRGEMFHNFSKKIFHLSRQLVDARVVSGIGSIIYTSVGSVRFKSQLIFAYILPRWGPSEGIQRVFDCSRGHALRTQPLERVWGKRERERATPPSSFHDGHSRGNATPLRTMALTRYQTFRFNSSRRLCRRPPRRVVIRTSERCAALRCVTGCKCRSQMFETEFNSMRFSPHRAVFRTMTRVEEKTGKKYPILREMSPCDAARSKIWITIFASTNIDVEIIFAKLHTECTQKNAFNCYLFQLFRKFIF